MKTLALYADENGEPQQAIIEHDEMIDVASNFDCHKLPVFNEGCNLFLLRDLRMPDTGDEHEGRPDITDGYGQEVPCHFITLEA